jgi:glycerate kinase
MIAGIPRVALLAGAPIARGTSAAGTLAAVARGVREAGAPEPDVCALPAHEELTAQELRALLEELGFDARMLAARALIACEARLEPDTLSASLTFELATRARQAGVPAFAIAGASALGAFEARLLDLQAIEQARSARGLVAAGLRVALLL